MNERGIEEIISTLYEMVQDARNVPLSSDKCMIERDRVLDLLDEISNRMPGELKQARTIVESRSEVINNAKREAENILTLKCLGIVNKAEIDVFLNSLAVLMIQKKTNT